MARTQCEDENKNDSKNKKKINEWVEGLSLVLSGVRAATSRLATSAPMAHNIVYQLGDRFVFSHDFADLLITQLEQVLEGNIDQTTFILRTRTTTDNNDVHWKEIFAND